MAIVVKHTDDFKKSDVTAHNTSIEKMLAKFKACNISCGAIAPETLESFKAKPGFYVKDGGQWKGPFDAAQDAQDAKAEWDWERKHS